MTTKTQRRAILAEAKREKKQSGNFEDKMPLRFVENNHRRTQLHLSNFLPRRLVNLYKRGAQAPSLICIAVLRMHRISLAPVVGSFVGVLFFMRFYYWCVVDREPPLITAGAAL